MSILSQDFFFIKFRLFIYFLIFFRNLRTRRPERAFYVPRAKRSQTTPPSQSNCCINTISSPSKSHTKKSEKSKSIDESTSSSSATEELNETVESSPSVDQFLESTVIDSLDITINSQSSAGCDLSNQNCSEEDSETDQKNQKNLNNIGKMSRSTEKDLIIGNNASNFGAGVSDKIDKDEKELLKASQEINRSNRKLIKQTFNSNVLEIESASGGVEEKTDESALNKDDGDDDWDTL